ncbi:hypothetical protein EMPS_10159 [Entomortierella parvispora]|uniref:Protein-serine/threonine kinase n=1 Tax=Entomortierella parvispora TaxID=205924 RepID=A0A9P3M1A2_9FUNG|nr:hypothetical protein EMPS_10159 [Entomortierella parvispora]
MNSQRTRHIARLVGRSSEAAHAGASTQWTARQPAILLCRHSSSSAARAVLTSTSTLVSSAPRPLARSIAAGSKRSLSIQAPPQGRASAGRIAGHSKRTVQLSSSSVSEVIVLPSCVPSLLQARRTVFTQSEPKESDDVVSFYDDKVTQYASQEIQTVTLKTLLGLGRSGSSSTASEDQQQQQHSTDLEVNLGVARYARKELPVRLARLIKATQKLPFIVGTNPYIKRVYKLYYDSFQTITASPEEIEDKEALDRFAAVLQGLVESHADVVPMLSQGFQECKKYMKKDDIKKFLDEMIRARIGIRLIAEQVISLQEQRHQDGHLEADGSSSEKETALGGDKGSKRWVGVVDRELKPAELIRSCASFVQELCDVNYGSSPEVVINGQTDTTFTYVPVHLEYILCELLKNSVRATVEHSQKMGRSALNPHGHGGHQETRTSLSQSGTSKASTVIMNEEDELQDLTKRPNEFGHPPVEVTIAKGDHEITIRIRDHGGGISREDFDAIFDYSFTTVKNENESSPFENTDAGAGDSPYGVDSIFKGVSRLAMQAGLGGPIAGLGFGLPLTRIYAQYFGGKIDLIPLQGYGCDVFLKLKQIDETLDDLQI